MRKLKDASRENDGKKSQIIEWLNQLIQDLYKEIRILIDSQIINNSILDSIFVIYNSP